MRKLNLRGDRQGRKMSFQFSSSDHELQENHEINVTPFIDVMLVLLIIFMVAAPLATVSVPVDLPTSSAKPNASPSQPVYLSVGSGQMLQVDEHPAFSLEEASQKLPQWVANKQTRLYLRADKTLPYQSLLEVINTLSQAGYQQVGLVGIAQSASSSS